MGNDKFKATIAAFGGDPSKVPDDVQDPTDGIDVLLRRRSAAISSLVTDLGHLDKVRIISILTSFMNVDHLEEVAAFQAKDRQ